ncbi:hypothetical protein KKB10_03900 [Patescibacteria group bacterium]|nr:hypothetical protein [Patescibacteria group bacterium]MBU1951916.1 hypothetical protein [Patescibacteria group bacterium]
MSDTNSKGKDLAIIIISFIATFAGVIFIIFFKEEPTITINANTNQTTNTNQPIPSEYPDYVAIKGEKADPDMRQFIIGVNKEVKFGAEESNIATLGGITKRIKVNGELSRAYLFFEGTVDGLPLSAFDDLYLLINNAKGGHIVEDDNYLPTPPGDTTKILLNLKSVTYYPKIINKRSETNKKLNIDLFSNFEVDEIIEIFSFISSERSPRITNELSIYYECKEGVECSLDPI